jgi:hypothetical protein
MADTASSNLGTEPIGIYPASGHPFKNPKMLGSEFTWPYMLPIASAASGSMALDVNSMSPGGVPDVPSLGTDVSIINRDAVDITSDAKAPANATSALNTMRAANTTAPANATSAVNTTTATNTTSATNATKAAEKQKPAGWGQRKPRVDQKMTKEQIKNSTNLQRVYRNAFVGTTMHKAYEGQTQYPTWITPYDNGTGCFNACDRNKMMDLALKKVVPGAHIAPVFWDL